MARPQRAFILKEGSLQARFLAMRSKVQMYGGGFGNGKTTAMVIKALELAKDYPGSTGLLARSTYPKLNDTLRKEFLKWCPPEWIKSFPLGQNGSNVCTLKNGSTIYFRYIAQQGKSAESTTSNLLSATYDWAGIDQIEDPEIMHKDFLDLFGRLRGSTPYAGDDPTMPKTGPRWIMLACNPTGNWVYTKIVRPLHMYQHSGIITDDLLCIRDMDRNPVMRVGPDGRNHPQLLLGLVEGSTYELRHIHEADGGDFIQTQESLYQGQQRERYLLGKWAAYEGLVYAQYDSTVHQLRERDIEEYLAELRANGYEPTWREGYDFGQASPSCYGLSFTTPSGQVILADGFYKPEYAVDDQAAHIIAIRERWADYNTKYEKVLADPSIWGRKGASNKGLQGKTIAQMFKDEKIGMRRGNNDIKNGIAKVQKYLLPARHLVHPITKVQFAPRFYVNMNLTWFNDEITSYYWKQNSSGQRVDVPNDTNDHAMDMTKYLLSDAPDVGQFYTPPGQFVPQWMMWQEDHTVNNKSRSHRYG